MKNIEINIDHLPGRDEPYVEVLASYIDDSKADEFYEDWKRHMLVSIMSRDKGCTLVLKDSYTDEIVRSTDIHQLVELMHETEELYT